MTDRIVTYFHIYGLVSVPELADFLQVSHSTVSRRLIPYINDRKVITLGKGKNTKYIYLRNIPDVNQPIIIREVNEKADVSVAGKLWVTNTGTVLETDTGFILYDDLPWYLLDLRPQGFIGRMITKHVSSKLNVPIKSENWSGDDLLRYLIIYSHDTPGCFELCTKFLSPRKFNTNRITLSSKLDQYDRYVIDLSKGGAIANSAGGEQPKFHSRWEDKENQTYSIVKYSPLIEVGNPVALRIKDLLICEDIALTTLYNFNGHAALTKLLTSEQRVYLEVTRFDRVVVNNLEGQIGMVSLETVLAEFSGHADNWIDASIQLNEMDLLSDSDSELLNTWLAYSRFISNSDTHNGNVSLFLDNLQLNGLTPAYDILPMAYMPTKGDVPTPEIRIKKPNNINEKSWNIGRVLGLEFWNIVKETHNVSHEFREIAANWILYINSMDE